MHEFSSTQFGVLHYEPEQVLHFPAGLPAFEEERSFLAVEDSSHAPIIFLQSLLTPDLAFLTLPVACVVPDYEFEPSEEDLTILGWPPGHRPGMGDEALCLAIVTVGADGAASANLMAPVVVNRSNRKAVQSIQSSGLYSHEHPLGDGVREESC